MISKKVVSSEENRKLLENGRDMSQVEGMGNQIWDVCDKKNLDWVLIFFDTSKEDACIIGAKCQKEEKVLEIEWKLNGLTIQKDDIRELREFLEMENECYIDANQYADILLFEVFKK